MCYFSLKLRLFGSTFVWSCYFNLMLEKKNRLDLPPLICLCLQTSMNVKALRQISVTPTLSVTTLKDPTLATAVWAIQEMVKIAQVNRGVIFRAYRKWQFLFGVFCRMLVLWLWNQNFELTFPSRVLPSYFEHFIASIFFWKNCFCTKLRKEFQMGEFPMSTSHAKETECLNHRSLLQQKHARYLWIQHLLSTLLFVTNLKTGIVCWTLFKPWSPILMYQNQWVESL